MEEKILWHMTLCNVRSGTTLSHPQLIVEAKDSSEAAEKANKKIPYPPDSLLVWTVQVLDFDENGTVEL